MDLTNCKPAELLGFYLGRFWRVSVPQETLGADGSGGDPSRPVPLADKVRDGAEVDEAPAADAVPAGNLRQVHQAGGQRHTCLLETSSTFHRRRRENGDSEEPALSGLSAEPPPHLRREWRAPESGRSVLLRGAPPLPDTVREPCSPPPARTAARPPKCCWPPVAAVVKNIRQKTSDFIAKLRYSQADYCCLPESRQRTPDFPPKNCDC